MNTKSFNEDVTEKVTAYFLTLVNEFYSNPNNEGADILMFWQQCQDQSMRGWKKIIMQHYPYNFNEHLAKCTDVSKRKIERISLKN
jgi:hypothetical protein